MTSLSEIYGHEESLSKAIAESNSFEELLNICGVVPTEKPIYETRVDLGHDDRQGRIDIIQPTTAGIVIVEVQYGTSDSSHARRLQNYATNFRKPAFVIWVAENFRKEHIALFEQAKTPVLCAKVSSNEGILTLTKASPIFWTKQSQAKRIKEAHRKCIELMSKLFTGESSTHCYEKRFIPMYQFFGQTQYRSASAARSRRFKDRYKKEGPRNKAWDFEANIEAIIQWYLQGLPKKTHFYLLKHPSFYQTKEQWKDEMSCYWMLRNMLNDHPYIDAAYEPDVESMPIEHESRDGPWAHSPWYLAHQRLCSGDTYSRLFDHDSLSELIEIEQKSGYSKGDKCSIMEYAWDMAKHAAIKSRLIHALHVDTDEPIHRLAQIDFNTFHKIRSRVKKLFEERRKDSAFPLNDVLYRQYKKDCKEIATGVLHASGY